jgi:tRNA (guanine37-N1)-methyltransferase
MPLPKSAEDFLKEAKMLSKKGTIVHFYNFLHEDEFEEAEKMVSKVFKKWKKVDLVKCGQHAPRVFRICLDFKVM